MTGLLSAGNADEVRAFVGAKPPAEPVAHPLEAECAQLRHELAATQVAVADLKRDQMREIEEALEHGRCEGLAQAESREAERLTALREALENAAQLLDRKLIGLDRLAAELASVALMRLLDEPTSVSAMSAAFITRQVQALKGAGIVHARVSNADFADEASLAGLIGRLHEAGASIEVTRDPALGTGQAQFAFALGRADLDLTSQWQSLATLLRDMASD